MKKETKVTYKNSYIAFKDNPLGKEEEEGLFQTSLQKPESLTPFRKTSWQNSEKKVECLNHLTEMERGKISH